MSILKRSKTKEEKKELSKENSTAPVVSYKKETFSGIEHGILKRPHLSEKAYGIQSKNQYIFWVDSFANKPMIKREIEKRYNVHVSSINTVTNASKTKFFRGKTSTKKAVKKAIITVKKGEKIEIA